MRNGRENRENEGEILIDKYGEREIVESRKVRDWREVIIGIRVL